MKSGTLLRQVVNKLKSEHRLQRLGRPPPLRRHLRADPARPAGRGQRRRVLHAARRHPVHRRPGRPALGETLLDPACGTGGFLTCAIEHVRKQYVKTPSDEARCRPASRGVEKKPLPHLLCVTNMIVHGIDVPTGIRHDNTLARPLRDWGRRTAWTSSSPTRPSAAWKRTASRTTSRPSSAPARRPTSSWCSS
jgi:type I restriction enzyme M protein